MDQSLAIWGQGWAFPPSFSKGGRELQMASGIEDIQQSLEILLGTRLNERILLEDYGCNLQDYLFEEISPSIVNQIEHIIEEAVLYHEPRIEMNAVIVERDQLESGLLNIRLDFDIPSSNSRYNMVYPFYILEAG